MSRFSIYRGKQTDSLALLWIAISVPFVLLLNACGQSRSSASNAPSIHLAADTVTEPLAASLINVYENQVPDTLITLRSSSRTSVLAALRSGEADAVLLMYPPEGRDLFSTPIGYDQLAIVGSPDLPVTNVSQDTLRAIFGGQVTNLSEAGGVALPIQVITWVRDSSERTAFEEAIMQHRPWATSARLVSDTEQLQAILGSTPGSIGYMAYSNLGGQVKLLSVDGVAVASNGTRNNNYPLTTPIVFVTRQEPQGRLRGLLEWILGDVGQQTVRQHVLGLSR